MKTIWEFSLRGVYGEHAKVQNLNYGGPECAAMLPDDFKIFANLALVSSLT